MWRSAEPVRYLLDKLGPLRGAIERVVVHWDVGSGVEYNDRPGDGFDQPVSFDVVLRIRNAESYQRKKNRSDVACTQCLGVGCPADAQCSPSIIKTVAENTLLRIALRIIGSPFGG
jgi:hypothetical protein